MQATINKGGKQDQAESVNKKPGTKSLNSMSTKTKVKPDIQLKTLWSSLATQASPVQTKLKVGAANDKYEQEADAVANQVMRTPMAGHSGEVTQSTVPKIQTSSVNNTSIQRACDECEGDLEERASPVIQRKAIASQSQAGVTSSVANTINSPGSGTPLSDTVRSRIEPVLGADLSAVRVHSNNSAQEASEKLNAKAFANGNNIFIGRGECASDLHLMAHEATHVVQQGSRNLIQRTCASTDIPIFDQRVTECRAHPAYSNLSASSRALADEIITVARTSDRCLYYIGKLKLLLDTPDAPPAETATESREEVDEAVVEETQRLADNPGNTNAEELVSGHPIRNWTIRQGRGGINFLVDRDDPNNIVVKIKVHLSPEGSGTVADVANTKSLEDGIEKHASTRGYTLDIAFVDHSNPDVFEVGVNPDEWTTSGNWVGDVSSIAHEAHHLLGLRDRYNYIESHADNEDLAIGDRLHWFREQMRRAPDPQGVNSMMNDHNLSLLDDDVCNVAGLPLDQCVAAREAGAVRASGVTTGPQQELTSQGLCIKSFFGGEVTFQGLSPSVLSDIAVINEDTGLVLRPVNNVTYDCDGFWYRFRTDWFKIPDHCSVTVNSSPANPGFYSQCCNFTAGLFVNPPRWSTDNLDASKLNPFGVTE